MRVSYGSVMTTSKDAAHLHSKRFHSGTHRHNFHNFKSFWSGAVSKCKSIARSVVRSDRDYACRMMSQKWRSRVLCHVHRIIAHSRAQKRVQRIDMWVSLSRIKGQKKNSRRRCGGKREICRCRFSMIDPDWLTGGRPIKPIRGIGPSKIDVTSNRLRREFLIKLINSCYN